MAADFVCSADHPPSSLGPETIDIGPEIAYGAGYPESKWVTEQLFGRAARQTGLRTTAVRVGQVSGDQRTGGWNTTEWVAALVRVSQRLGYIPSKDEVRTHVLYLFPLSPAHHQTSSIAQDLTWVAVDVVAQTLQEMIYSDELALHVVSPRPVPWNAVFLPIAERLGLPTLPYDEWVAKLEQSAASANKGPGVEGHEAAHNLIAFFKSEGMGGAAVPLSTEKAVIASKALADARPIGKQDALNYVEFWAKVGHLKLQ